MKRIILLVIMLLLITLVSASYNYEELSGNTLDETSSFSAILGAEIRINSNDVCVVNVTKSAISTATHAYLYNYTSGIACANYLQKVAYIGNLATFVCNSTNNFKVGEYAFIGNDAEGATYIDGYIQPGSGLPVSGTYHNRTAGYGSCSAGTIIMSYSDSAYEIYKTAIRQGADITQNFTISATDFYNGLPISNLSVNISGVIFDTINGSINTNLNLSNSSSLWNITISSNSSGGYFNRTYLNYNITSNLISSLHQAELFITPRELLSGNIIYGGNFTEGSQIVNNGNSLKLKAGNFDIIFRHENYTTTTTNFSLSLLQNLSVNITVGSGQLIVNATNILTNLKIQNFSITATTGNYSITKSTTNYSIYLSIDVNQTYNLTIDAPGYVVNSTLFYLQNSSMNYTFFLYTSNSIRIFIYNESNILPLLGNNVSMRFTSNNTEFTYYTNTSTFYLDNLVPAEYQILFSTYGYAPRTYTVTIGNRTTQSLTAYLTTNYSTTLFTVVDFDSLSVLENVLSTMYKFIGGSWKPVESKYTDVTGKVQFYYDPTTNYKFYLSKSGYNDNIFNLNPILFSTYDIKLIRSTTINYSQDFDKLSVNYAPGIFANNNVTSFSWIISSPYGLLENYGINLTYPGGNVTASGTNAIGGQLTVNVNITNADVFDRVTLNYYYTTSLSGLREFTVSLPIITGGTHATFMTNQDRTYGLGIFERILIMTLIILFVIGIATLVGQPITGMALGLIVLGYMAFIGFIPLWSILPSMFIGVLFLMWKSGAN